MARQKPVYGPKKPLYCHSPPFFIHVKRVQREITPENLSHSSSSESDYAKITSLSPLTSAEQFSNSYSTKLRDLDLSWEKVPELATIERPSPYKSSSTESDEFLDIEDTEKFTKTLSEPTTLSSDALHAVTANAAYALKALQDEHTAISNLVLRTTGDVTLHDIYHEKKPNPRTKSSYWRKLDPQYPEDTDRHERLKESVLYNYKYKQGDGDEVQDPWNQGGFVPTTEETNAFRTERGENVGNVDGFPTVRNRKGIETAPRRTIPPPEPKKDKKKLFEEAPVPTGPRTTRGKKRRYDFESEETQTPLDSDDEGAFDTPGKMTTRFRGLKKPPTRSASVTPLPMSMNASPVPKRPRVQKPAFPKNALATSNDMSVPPEGGKKAPEKNPNRSRGMRELWKRRKESGWVRKPKGTAKVDTKALAAAEKKAEDIRRNSQVTAPFIPDAAAMMEMDAAPTYQDNAE